MKEFFAQNKSLTTWAIVAAVIGVIVYFIYRWGKNNASVGQVTLPTDQPGTKISTADAQAVRSMSQKLYNEIDSWFNADDSVFSAFMAMSDTLFVAVYNDYNSLYFKETKETLRKAISEVDTIDRDLREGIENRMIRLNLAK